MGIELGGTVLPAEAFVSTAGIVRKRKEGWDGEREKERETGREGIDFHWRY